MYTYIWKIVVEGEDKQTVFIENWRRASQVMQEYTGAHGTCLHTAADESNTFYAIAEWESKAARDAMEADRVAGSERAQSWEKFAKNEAFGRPTTVAKLEQIGEVSPQQ